MTEHSPAQSEGGPLHQIGDIEPPIEILDLLFRSTLVKDLDLEYDIGDTEPLMSLFDFESGTPSKSVVVATPKKKGKRAHTKKQAPTAVEEPEVDIGEPGPSTRRPSLSSSKKRRVQSVEAIDTAVDGEPVEEIAETPPQSTPWGQKVFPKMSENAEELSKQDTFLHFDSGWVLPAGSKRHRKGSGPTPVEVVKKPVKKSTFGLQFTDRKPDY